MRIYILTKCQSFLFLGYLHGEIGPSMSLNVNQNLSKKWYTTNVCTDAEIVTLIPKQETHFPDADVINESIRFGITNTWKQWPHTAYL